MTKWNNEITIVAQHLRSKMQELEQSAKNGTIYSDDEGSDFNVDLFPE